MAQALSPQFRPGIVVFVGRESESILRHVWTLLQSLELPLRRCIGLVRYDDNTSAYVVSTEGEVPQGMPATGVDNFITVFRRTLSRVQGERGRQNVVDALSPMPNVQTQIYLVGQAYKGAHELSQAFESVLRQLRSDVLDTQICYILNEYGRVNAGGAGTNASPAALGLFDLPNFCYLYEEISMRPTFLEEEDSHYSAAETLFSLLATGVTASPKLKEAFSLREGLEQYDGHIGGMSTSMVMFPRYHAERYCADLLGAALLRYWRTANVGVLSDHERKEQERRAQAMASSIHGWMRESETRPGTQSSADTKEYRWPNLGILRERSAPAASAAGGVGTVGGGAQAVQSQQDPLAHARYSMGRRLKEQTERLFMPLSFEAVTAEYRRQLQGSRRVKRKKANPESWVNIVEQRAKRSDDSFQQWSGQARVAWVNAREKVLEQVRATFNELSTTNKNGIELTHIYVEELHERLKDVAEELVRWRVHHDEDYKNRLSEFDELADGEWAEAISIASADVGGTVALHPVAGQAPIVPANGPLVPNGPVIVGGNTNNPGSPVVPEFHHMPPREERIARRLAQRVSWYEAQIPALTNIASATFMAAPTLAVLGMGLAPSLNASPLQGIYMAGSIAGVGISSGYAYRLYQQNSVLKAKQDLINFYRCYYVHRCESREDTLRTLALSPLMRLVAEMREQLQDMRARLTRIEDVLREDVGNTVQELFDGPAASRDIFVANGERLYRDGRNRYGHPQYTLAQFAARVEQERLEKPREEFHRTYEEMTAHMLHWFDQEGIPILNSRRLADADAATRVREFALGITRQYLNGSLVDIGATLADEEVLNFVSDRVEVPLYRFSSGRASADFQFVAGCDRHLTNVMKSKKFINVDQVHTINTEWLLVSSFFRGHSLFGIDSTVLFPLKANVNAHLGGGGLISPNVNVVGPEGENQGGVGLIGQNGGVNNALADFHEDEYNANLHGDGMAGQNGGVDAVEHDFHEFDDESFEPAFTEIEDRQLPVSAHNWSELTDDNEYDYEELPLVDGQQSDVHAEYEQTAFSAPEQGEREYHLPRLQGPGLSAGYQMPPSEEEETVSNERTYRVPELRKVILHDDEEESSLKDVTPHAAGGSQQPMANKPPVQPKLPEDKATRRAGHEVPIDAQQIAMRFGDILGGLIPKPNNPNVPTPPEGPSQPAK